MEEQYSSHMIKALLAGIRKPNPEIRYKLRHIVPFEVWGRDIRGWLKEQKEKAKTCSSIKPTTMTIKCFSIP